MIPSREIFVLITVFLVFSESAAAEQPLWTDGPVRVNREAQQLERLPDTEQPATIAPDAFIRFSPILRPDDSASFVSGGQSYRVAGLSGFEPNQICRRDNGQRWACGVQGRATLRAMILRRNTRCSEIGVSGDEVLIECKMGETDLADYMVAQGLAHRVEEERTVSDDQDAEDASASEN